MSKPAAHIGGTTVTGDAILPLPGRPPPTVTISSQVPARMGDKVDGAACTGAVTLASMTVTINSVPAARVGDQVMGVNPASGAPVTTAIAPPGIVTVLIGG
ncbi:hypothetical protein [Nitriliruptor alkaliphilus]|uniref:hypothetical protein n=1 Tax=Nitriliruptor alkaliphilus TaxID=427918 RepID=UPI0006977074|nr:hypothetical protein [Nitriliruptor alkaliphilus]